ncbi:hypothetical protein JTE90_023448 [Oedothorax gibbosus]|uniref:Uncharacterized protein n=1 Tax=Oedothorax gibbosus TaxID=931172 RepID=A0AAV6U162_9ARAC|nr:hypothetical protein JTE90_023448 [Oedothorax gibbosus]
MAEPSMLEAEARKSYEFARVIRKIRTETSRDELDNIWEQVSTSPDFNDTEKLVFGMSVLECKGELPGNFRQFLLLDHMEFDLYRSTTLSIFYEPLTNKIRELCRVSWKDRVYLITIAVMDGKNLDKEVLDMVAETRFTPAMWVDMPFDGYNGVERIFINTAKGVHSILTVRAMSQPQSCYSWTKILLLNADYTVKIGNPNAFSATSSLTLLH